ncbi:hypothetical protein FRUB_05532 [Fimbriiglobus ruber]|uniref:DUF2029 domain-containing protein n=1 Tax=Fimbriiglobus ruber TaxID=1908690 RepID=A0A225DHY9_9BACT|nr:hypothetical protein FRUB_05532 [Fimbriiglobus ruber]
MDNNSGHAQIDFGGQWMMGRLVATGHARDLYHRGTQWKLAWAGFPPENESPYIRRNVFPHFLREPGEESAQIRHDAEWMMYWFMGEDSDRWPTAAGGAVLPLGADALCPNPLATAALVVAARDQITPEVVAAVDRPAVGGPLYPPIHGFLYAPLGLFDRPQEAYFAFQLLSLGLTFVAGLGVNVLSRGWIWWPVATTVILLFPGYRCGLDLGQNQIVTLTILIWGWVLAARGRSGWGGVVWGLLAFKPVWALAFFLAPLLMRRWRFCATMAATGIVLGAATLPFVGLQTWFEWLDVGKEASETYRVNENWIKLSRDLGGLIRRAAVDFSVPEANRGDKKIDAAAWGMWAVVFATTVGVYLWRGRQRAPVGFAAGFLFLGAYLCCYRFMYYDIILALLPMAVLFADPRRFSRATVFEPRQVEIAADSKPRPVPVPVPSDQRCVGYINSALLTVLVALLLVENMLPSFPLEGSIGFGYLARETRATNGTTTVYVPKLTIETSVYYAWETMLLLVLWAWCGWRLLLNGDCEDATSTDVS